MGGWVGRTGVSLYSAHQDLIPNVLVGQRRTEEAQAFVIEEFHGRGEVSCATTRVAFSPSSSLCLVCLCGWRGRVGGWVAWVGVGGKGNEG